MLGSAEWASSSRLEAFFERFFEAPAGRLGATLQPVSLEKRIERAMDASKSFRDDGVIVPNHYDLHLQPGRLTPPSSRTAAPWRTTLPTA